MNFRIILNEAYDIHLLNANSVSCRILMETGKVSGSFVNPFFMR